MPESNDGPPFIRCKWTAQELDGQIVEHFLTYPLERGFIEQCQGVGHFMVLSERDGMMRLVVDITTVNWSQGTGRQIQLPMWQRHAEQIERHPEANSGKENQPQFRVQS